MTIETAPIPEADIKNPSVREIKDNRDKMLLTKKQATEYASMKRIVEQGGDLTNDEQNRYAIYEAIVKEQE